MPETISKFERITTEWLIRTKHDHYNEDRDELKEIFEEWQKRLSTYIAAQKIASEKAWEAKIAGKSKMKTTGKK